MARGLYPIRAVDPEPDDGDQVVTSAEFQKRTGHYLWRVSNGHQVLIVTSNTRPVAAVIPVAELERLRQIERRWEEALADGLHDLDV